MMATPQTIATCHSPAWALVRTAVCTAPQPKKTSRNVPNGIRSFGNYLVRHPPLAQGGYYVVRGLWPLIGAAFFWSRAEVATFWYAQATGVLILAIGVTLLMAGVRHASEGREAQAPEI